MCGHVWFLSMGRERQNFGTVGGGGIDFYYHKASSTIEESARIYLPPTQGWYKNNNGLDPPPKLTFVDPNAEKFKRVRLYTERVYKEAFTLAWQHRLLQVIAKYVLHNSLDDTAEIDKEFQKLEFFERVNALEMVIWKSATIVEKFPTGSGYHEVMEWIHKDWKMEKADSRRSHLIHVVMENTVPFMDKPWANNGMQD